MRISVLIAIAVLAVTSFEAAAYNTSEHKVMTEIAVNRSALNPANDPTLLLDLGLSWTDTSFVSHNGTATGSIEKIAGWGAIYEDCNFFEPLFNPTLQILCAGNDLQRPFNHFFDVQYNNFQGRPLTDSPWNGPLGNTSVDWALEDTAQISSVFGTPTQLFSYRDAQQYFLAGLTQLTGASRKASMSRVFQSLGQVVHHVQDMGQPQHTRNEQHLKGSRRSEYEVYSSKKFSGPGAIPAFLASVPQYGGGIAPALPSARSYWNTLGGVARRIGMAEFTGTNFVTFASGFRVTSGAGNPPSRTIASHPNFPLPGPLNSDGTSKRIVATDVVLIDANGQQVIGSEDYVLGKIYDEYTGSLSPEIRLGRLSMVARRQLSVTGRAAFTTAGPFIWEAQYAYLLPRAVAFSTGLVNHFFRGRLDLRRSDNGSGWVIENRSISGNTLDGFFSVLWENPAGERRAVPGAAWSAALSAGQSMNVSFAEPPGDTAKLIAVFYGRIGTAEPPMSQSGFFSVAGKVISYSPPPIACGTPIRATGGSDGFEGTLALGSAGGTVNGEFEAYDIPDSLVIRKGSSTGSVLYTTNGLVSGFSSFSFQHSGGSTPTDTQVHVRVTGNTNTQTAWAATVLCPGQSLNNTNRAQPRRAVTIRVSNAFSQGVVGSCSGQARVNGSSIGNFQVASPLFPSEFIITLSAGPGHQLSIANYTCQPNTQNVIPAWSITDGGGTRTLQPSPGYFTVN